MSNSHDLEIISVNQPPSSIELKIAYLGGGSREWARQLTIDRAREMFERLLAASRDFLPGWCIE